MNPFTHKGVPSDPATNTTDTSFSHPYRDWQSLYNPYTMKSADSERHWATMRPLPPVQRLSQFKEPWLEVSFKSSKSSFAQSHDYSWSMLMLLRPSTRHSRCRISVSRAFGEGKGMQQLSLLSCLTGAEPRRQAWLSGFRGSQAIGLRIRGFTSEGIGRVGLQTQ